MSNTSKIVKIPSFTNDQDPALWLDIFDASTKLLQVKDEEKLDVVPGYLDAPAVARWFFDQNFKTWEAFKTSFLDRFSDHKISVNTLLVKPMKLRKKDFESLRDYMERFDHLHTEYSRAAKKNGSTNEVSDDLLKDALINGIRPKALRTTIRSLQPKTLLEVKHVILRDFEDSEDSDDENEINDKVSETEYKSKEKVDSRLSGKNVWDRAENRNKKAVPNDTQENQPEEKQDNSDLLSLDRKVEELTSTMKNLTLLVQDFRVKGEPSQNNSYSLPPRDGRCFNCQERGHSAKDCTKPCKLCNGAQGDHVYWNCSLYARREGGRNQGPNGMNSYLVMPTESSKASMDIRDEEVYAVEKRQAVDSGKENRVSRSGKRVRVHDTVPQQKSELRRKIQTERRTPEKIKNPVTVAQDRTSEKRAQQELEGMTQEDTTLELVQNGVLPGNNFQAADVLKAKVYRCSLEQIMTIKGFKTDLYKQTRKKQKNPKIRQEPIEVLKVDSDPVRGEKGQRVLGVGAPKVEAIVAGKISLEAVMDADSHGSIVSARLAKSLGIELDKEGNGLHRMADGNLAPSSGIIEDLLVLIQGVYIRLNPVIFEKPTYDLLLGSEALELLGVSADYGNKHFCIRGDRGMEPLSVSFSMERTKFKLLDPVNEFSYEEESMSHFASSETSSSSESEIPEERFDQSYMIVPCDPMPKIQESLQSEPVEQNEERIKSILENQVLQSEMIETQKVALLSLLNEYLDVFGVDYGDLKQTNLVKLHVDTGDAKPILKRPNRFMSHGELELLRKEIETMVINEQLIPTSHLPDKSGNQKNGWAFPCMYVKKKNGEKRLVVQFQDLNAVTVKDPWPLPAIQDLLESYVGALMFTSVDLLKGFNQILVDDESIPKLTMSTP